MLSFRPALRQPQLLTPCRHALYLSSMRKRYKSNVENTYQPPTATSGQGIDPRSSDAKPHRAFYGNFGMPLLKGFLMALLTYQVTYWGWLKLESMEVQREKQGELKSLEDKIRQIAGSTKST